MFFASHGISLEETPEEDLPESSGLPGLLDSGDLNSFFTRLKTLRMLFPAFFMLLRMLRPREVPPRPPSTGMTELANEETPSFEFLRCLDGAPDELNIELRRT